MTIINIDGINLPSPIEYQVTLADIDSDNSGRSDSGYMSRDRVRSNICSISISWAYLTIDELNTIITQISKESFTVKYFYGDYRTATMYSGDKDIEMKYIDNQEQRWNLSASLIEY